MPSTSSAICWKKRCVGISDLSDNAMSTVLIYWTSIFKKHNWNIYYVCMYILMSIYFNVRLHTYDVQAYLIAVKYVGLLSVIFITLKFFIFLAPKFVWGGHEQTNGCQRFAQMVRWSEFWTNSDQSFGESHWNFRRMAAWVLNEYCISDGWQPEFWMNGQS